MNTSNFDRQISLLALIWVFASLSEANTVIYITDFGAVSDDGIDDLPAIELAIGGANQGDCIMIPSGIWDISDVITLKDGIEFTGAGMDATTIRYTGTKLNRLIDIGGTSDVSISGFTLSGQNNVYAAHGIGGGNADSIYIREIRVRDFVETSTFGPSGVYFSTSVSNSSITDCEFIDIGLNSEWGAAIRVGQVEGQTNTSSNITVHRNKITGTGRGGILLDNAKDVSIRENTISGSGQTAEGLGIEVYGGSDRAIVEDNVIDHWLSIDRSTHVAVRRNIIRNINGSVKSFGLEAAGACENTIFADNVVDQGAHIGISISNKGLKEYLLWTRNTISGAETWGGQIQGETEGAFRIYFRSNVFTEVDSSAPNLFSDAGHGLRVNGNVNHIVFDQNQFIDNDTHGIQIRTENHAALPVNYLEFVGNKFERNQSNSVALSSDAGQSLKDIIWKSNSVTNNGSNVSLRSDGFAGTSAPSVTISGPTEGFCNQLIKFEINFIDDGVIDHLLWDLGSGLPTNESTSSVSYQSAGTYIVSVAVWDNDARAGYAEHTIKIFPEPIIKLEPIDTPSDSVRISFDGTEGYAYTLESTSNFNFWEPLANFSGAGEKTYIDNAVTLEPLIFYRIEVEE